MKVTLATFGTRLVTINECPLFYFNETSMFDVTMMG